MGMMIDFSKKICVEQNFCPQFNFDVLYTTSGQAKYNVSVPDKAGIAIYFTMKKELEDCWKIINAPCVPQWIMNIESQLNDTIMNILTGIS